MTFRNSKRTYKGIPVMASNMDTVGTFEMAKALAKVHVIYYFYYVFNYLFIVTNDIYFIDVCNYLYQFNVTCKVNINIKAGYFDLYFTRQ